MRIGPSVDVWPGALEEFYLVQILIHGGVQISHGKDRVLCAGSMAAVLSPGEHLRVQWSDNCTQMIVQIPREAVEIRLAREFGCRPQTPLKFQTAFDLDRPAGREWRRLLDFTVRTMDDGGIFGRDPLCSELEDLLLSGLMVIQPHNYADELRGARHAVPHYVLRAEREMRRRMAMRLDVPGLARAAGVSERTLHDGFRRFRGTTPMRRLTAMRARHRTPAFAGGEGGSDRRPRRSRGRLSPVWPLCRGLSKRVRRTAVRYPAGSTAPRGMNN